MESSGCGELSGTSMMVKLRSHQRRADVQRLVRLQPAQDGDEGAGGKGILEGGSESHS